MFSSRLQEPAHACVKAMMAAVKLLVFRELYRAYPELRRLRVRFSGGEAAEGFYEEREGREAMLRGVQQAVRRVEGWGKRSSEGDGGCGSCGRFPRARRGRIRKADEEFWAHDAEGLKVVERLRGRYEAARAQAQRELKKSATAAELDPLKVRAQAAARVRELMGEDAEAEEAAEGGMGGGREN